MFILDVLEWADAEDVTSSLTKASVSPKDFTFDGVSRVTTRLSEKGRIYGVTRVDLLFPTIIMLAKRKYMTMGWTRCRLKLFEKRQLTCYCCQKKGHLAIEYGNTAKPRRCYKYRGEGHVARNCSEEEL